MAGVKGRSGGARPNSGGARPGAGRKKKEVVIEAAPADSLEFMRAVMRDLAAPLKERVRCAVAIAQYEHVKKADGGKKDEAADKAKQAGAGKFAAAAPPLKLVTRR